MTDGEAQMIGTVRFSNVDVTHCYWLQDAIELMDSNPRGSWCLVRDYDEHPELPFYQQRYQQSKKGKENSRSFILHVT
jgi:hypothetical protein